MPVCAAAWRWAVLPEDKGVWACAGMQPRLLIDHALRARQSADNGSEPLHGVPGARHCSKNITYMNPGRLLTPLRAIIIPHVILVIPLWDVVISELPRKALRHRVAKCLAKGHTQSPDLKPGSPAPESKLQTAVLYR